MTVGGVFKSRGGGWGAFEGVGRVRVREGGGGMFENGGRVRVRERRW